MATYDLIERLNSTFREIEHELLTLTERLQTCRLLAARVFTLPEVAKVSIKVKKDGDVIYEQKTAIGSMYGYTMDGEGGT